MERGGELYSSTYMAFFAVIGRFGFRRQYRALSFHFPQFLFDKLVAPRKARAGLSFSQQFYRTPCVRCQHTRGFTEPDNSFYRTSGHVIDLFPDLGHGNMHPYDRVFVERIQKAKDFASGDEAIDFLDDSGVKPDKDLILSLIWELKQEWKLAFLVYKWGEKWDCVIEKSWCLMVWILGNHKKFSTAWSLIHELSNATKDTQRAMLIMIDRYAAANRPEKAIRTFNLMQKFKYSPDQTVYFTFLDILCKHGNIEEAEDFMYLNKKFFPLEVKGFNKILNGWCNITIDIYEAKRIWREMSKSCIEPDETSYTHMISCYSKVGNLFDSLRLYDDMRKRNWIPGIEVYHSLVYVLSHENCLSEALKIVDRMKEIGYRPDSTTYNLIISPLCEMGKFDAVKYVSARMIVDGVNPDRETYHALLKVESLEGTLKVLNHMRGVGLSPGPDTFYLLLEKWFRLDQPDNALTLWFEMKRNELKPNEMHYHIMVEGLVKRGLIAKGLEFYSEMKCSGLVDDPSLKKLIQASVPKKRSAGNRNKQTRIERYVWAGRGLRRWRGSSRIRNKA